jgi:hypothetical protein
MVVGFGVVWDGSLCANDPQCGHPPVGTLVSIRSVLLFRWLPDLIARASFSAITIGRHNFNCAFSRRMWAGADSIEGVESSSLVATAVRYPDHIEGGCPQQHTIAACLEGMFATIEVVGGVRRRFFQLSGDDSAGRPQGFAAAPMDVRTAPSLVPTSVVSS